MTVVLLVAGCTQPGAAPSVSLEDLPTPTLALPPTFEPPLPTLPPATPTLAQTGDRTMAGLDESEWRTVEPGMELRKIWVVDQERTEQVILLRFEPQQVRFHIGYTPDQPRFLFQWCQDMAPLVAVNGGFFDETFVSTALVISGGIASGQSYEGTGGMFAVDEQGQVSMRYLGEEAYDPDERLVEAMQGWPMLIKPGGVLVYTSQGVEQAERTVLALDQAGRVLVIVSPGEFFTLRSLADWLLSSDLEIDAAMNLMVVHRPACVSIVISINSRCLPGVRYRWCCWCGPSPSLWEKN